MDVLLCIQLDYTQDLYHIFAVNVIYVSLLQLAAALMWKHLLLAKSTLVESQYFYYIFLW